MKNVVTLVAQPGALLPDHVASVRAKLEEAGAKIYGAEWLAESEAFDLKFTQLSHEDALRIASEILGDAPVDIIAQPESGRRKKLLMTDMDSTVIDQECIDELGKLAGVGEQIAAVTREAMEGKLVFEESLRRRVALLKDQPVAILEQAKATLTFKPGAWELVHTMAANGAHCVLVSGGFTYFSSYVAEHLGFHEHHANVLQFDNDKLTGTVKEPVLGSDAKLHTLMRLTQDWEIFPEDTMAVGDGANDIPMLRAAGLGVAHHAKPKVQEAVSCRLNHTSLVSLLYAQGYHAHEIARPGAIATKDWATTVSGTATGRQNGI